MKGKKFNNKLCAFMLSMVMCVGVFQIPLSADTTDQNDSDSEEKPIYVSTIEITDLDAPAYDCYPDGEVTVVAKTADGLEVDAIEKYSISWTAVQIGKESGQQVDGGGFIYHDGSPLYKFDKEFFDDWLVSQTDEEPTLNAHVMVKVAFKEGYAASSDSFSCYVNGTDTRFYRYDDTNEIEIYGYGFYGIEKVLEDAKYSITCSQENVPGTISVSAYPSQAKAGDTCHIEIQLFAGSEFNSVTIDGQKITDYEIVDEDQLHSWSARRNKGDSLIVEYTMPAEDVTYEVDVTPAQFSIKLNETENGTAKLNKDSAVPYSDKVIVTVSPDEGYELESLVVSGVEPCGSEFNEDYIGEYGFPTDQTEYEITMPFADTTVTVTFKKIDSSEDLKTNTYSVIVGEGGTWNGESDYVVEVKSDDDDEHCLDRFVKATVDDHELVVGTECTVTKGSTIVTIKSDFLKSLSAGTHTVTVYFTDNKISTTLTINAAGSVDSGTTNAATLPSTGESQSPIVFVGIAMISVAICVAGITLSKKRKEEV